MPRGSDWVSELFLRRPELFLRIMEREEKLAEAIADLLRERGMAGAKVLDVGCGVGRVAIPLAKLGFTVVGLDISPLYLRRARERAEGEGVAESTRFLEGDARSMADLLAEHSPFDAVLFVWTSVLGYYDEETDLDVLRQAKRLTRQGGLLLILDTANQDYTAFAASFCGHSFFSDYGDFAVVEVHEYDPQSSRVRTRWTFYEKRGRDLRCVGESGYDVRVYALHELVSLAGRAGWRSRRRSGTSGRGRRSGQSAL